MICLSKGNVSLIPYMATTIEGRWWQVKPCYSLTL